MKCVVWTLLPLLATASLAEPDRRLRDTNTLYGLPLEQLLRVETQPKADVGSRSGERDALEAEVPIDIITSAQLRSSGYTELGRVLSKLVAGLNAPRPSIADGTDHAPPFTLRGLNPDQVLVLVNGKRRHQSSLLHMNGTIGRGSSGVDLNSLPLQAVERIEVLRDGAAAQYGSDAIAGIVNVILKGYGQTSTAEFSHGRTHAGDGRTGQTSVFVTQPLTGDGWVNLTAEYRDRGPTNRAGPDARDPGRINTHFGDADTQDTLLAFNAAVPQGDLTWWAHGTYNQRHSSAGAFFRRASDPRNLVALYPDGFLPLIEPDILDGSVSLGVRGVRGAGTQWDLSYTQGSQDMHFFVRQSLNRSLGPASPTAFDSGATRYTQHIVNLDLSRKLGDHHLAGGMEYRREAYRITPGEASSYMLGTATNRYPGAQGFGGFMPDNQVHATRNNVAAYVDLKYAATRWLNIDAAARAEHYSDFGATLDGKLALRARPTEHLLLRSSVSSGFRAPSLTQSHFTSTTTLRNAGELQRSGTFSVEHPLARALGATPLKPEESAHWTMGLVVQPSADLSLSMDGFVTDIDNRIMPTGFISRSGLSGLSPQAIEILKSYGVDGAVYFTNAIGTRTRGMDLRADYKARLSDGQRLKLSAAYHRSSTRIRRVNPAPGVLGVDMTRLILDPATQVLIESGQPQDAVKLWARYETPRFDLTLNLNRFGRLNSTLSGRTVAFAPRWTVDLDWSYRLSRLLTLSVGAENLFNAMPSTWGTTSDAIVGTGKVVEYSQYAPFGFNGVFYYLRLRLLF